MNSTSYNDSGYDYSRGMNSISYNDSGYDYSRASTEVQLSARTTQPESMDEDCSEECITSFARLSISLLVSIAAFELLLTASLNGSNP